jgi:hypothetical protein
MSREAAGIVAAVALCVAALWLSLRFLAAEPHAGPEPGPPVEATEPSTDLPGPDLPEPAIIDESPRPPRSREPPPATPAPVPIRSRFGLRGRLVGLEKQVPWRAPVFVLPRYAAARSSITIEGRTWRGDRRRRAVEELAKRAEFDPVVMPPPAFEDSPKQEQPLHALVAADGSFAIDLEPLFPTSRELWPLELDFVANDPLYMPLHQTAPMAVDTENPTVTLEVDVGVHPAAAVTGLVDAPGRGAQPSWRALDAVAGLFRDEAGTPAGTPVDWCVAGDRYRLRAPQSGGWFVVLALRDHEPAFERVQLELGEESELATSRLAPGSSISGRVVLPDRSFAFAQNLDRWLQVRAELDDASPHTIDLPEHTLAWSNGRLLNASVAAAASPAGHGSEFSLGGLREGRWYRIGLAATPGGLALSPELPSLRVRAPASGLEIPFDAAYVGVDESRGFTPMAGAEVSITGGPRQIRTGADGRAGFFVAPEHGYELLVTAKDHEPARASVRSGPVGTLARTHVVLEPIEPGAALALDVECEGLGTVHYMRLRFEREGSGGAAFVREAWLREDGLRYKQLPAGRFHVDVELLSEFFSTGRETPECVSGHWLLGAGFDVELRDRERVERRLSLRRGGKLRLSARNHDGGPLPAGCSIHDETGAEQDVVFAVRGDPPRVELLRDPAHRGGWWRVVEPPPRVTRRGEPTAQGPCETERALVPGRHAVTFTYAGYFPATVPVEVRSGEIHDVEVVLDRRP